MLNMCPTNIFINEANEAAQVLSEYPEFTLVSHRLCDRKIYRDARAKPSPCMRQTTKRRRAKLNAR